LDGVPFIGKCRVDVTFHPLAFGPDQPKGWWWEFDSWRKGEEKNFGTPKGQLEFDPKRIDVTISFPGTGYTHRTRFLRDPYNRGSLLLTPVL
jgi:hypothetical protein